MFYHVWWRIFSITRVSKLSPHRSRRRGRYRRKCRCGLVGHLWTPKSNICHMFHVWYIYLHLGDFRANVGKYSSTMVRIWVCHFMMRFWLLWKTLFIPIQRVFNCQCFLGTPISKTQNEENCGARPRDWLSRIRSVVTFFFNPVNKGRNFTRHG